MNDIYSVFSIANGIITLLVFVGGYMAIKSSQHRTSGEIQAQGNDAYLVARRDSHRREVVAESVGNGDGDVRQAIEGRFQPPEEGGPDARAGEPEQAGFAWG